MTVVPVLLAGGIGERFWPLSRTRRPKQILPLISRRTMLEETLARTKPLLKSARGAPKVEPLIVTGKAIASSIRGALKGKYRYSMIVEPLGKNTAPAVAIAAAYIEQRYGQSVMVVLSADHAISPRSGFVRAVRYASSLAERTSNLVVFGIPPSRPDTAYGYVELGRELETSDGETAFAVERFVEKPDWDTAVEYCSSGRYLWNSGMFVWRTDVILEEFGRHMPQLHELTRTAARAGFTTAALEKFYTTCEKESIDYGIMERSDRVVAVSGHFLWDDVGSWESVARIRPGNERRTTLVGKRVFERNCTNSIVFNDSSLHIAALGLDNMVLVVTEDAVLAIPRSELSQLKQYLTEMKKGAGFSQSLY
ncbi:MAG: NTP transferase domain-containing protein [Chitinivibrionales bacterium]|nr:NTP transferase domain-containing protein [Chitinivibrionales bacterium]